MRQIERRLEQLEASSKARPAALTVAVVESPFPTGDSEQWALDIVERLDCAAWVLEGPAFKVVLPPCDALTIPDGGEQERVWLEACRTYPHFVICGDGEGGILTCHFESEQDEREQWRSAQEQGVC